MKIEFPALQSEPLLYFLLHSGVFVLALAAVFFLLGLCMGAAVWGRYRKQLKLARAELAGQLEEIAGLKRKLAEQTLRPSTAPLPAPAPLLTEVLPSVAEVFPERKKPAAPAPQPAAAVPQMPVVAPAPASVQIQEEPLLPDAEAESFLIEPASEPPQAPPVDALQQLSLKLKSLSEPRPAPTAPPAAEDEGPEPFGFLLGEPAEASSPPAKSLSALAALIQAPVEPAAQAGDSIESFLASKPAKARASKPAAGLPEVLPELDDALGLIYKIPPAKADDLTRIRGIASMLEKRLNELGIYTWQQIAAWEDAHIREISSRLAFKDRITREKWVEQARALEQAQAA